MCEKISIIIPVYNAEKQLEKCLNSVIGQTYKDLEIVLIDDGSTDKSAEICQSFAILDKRIKYVYQNNKGVSAARNKGIDISTGEYIGFCDSDDWLENNIYEELYSIIQEADAEVSIVGIIAESNNYTSKYKDSGRVHIYTGKEAIQQMHLASQFEGQLCNKLFRKSIINDHRLDTNIKIFEDLLFLWPILLNANRVAFKDIHLYHYFYNTDSALNQPYRDADWQRREACLKMQAYAKSSFKEALPYVNKTFIMADIRLAEKMCESHCLSKEKRIFLQNEVSQLNKQEVYQLLTSDRKEKVDLFINKYVLFVLKTNWNMYKRRIKNILKIKLIRQRNIFQR